MSHALGVPWVPKLLSLLFHALEVGSVVRWGSMAGGGQGGRHHSRY